MWHRRSSLLGIRLLYPFIHEADTSKQTQRDYGKNAEGLIRWRNFRLFPLHRTKILTLRRYKPIFPTVNPHMHWWTVGLLARSLVRSQLCYFVLSFLRQHAHAIWSPDNILTRIFKRQTCVVAVPKFLSHKTVTQKRNLVCKIKNNKSPGLCGNNQENRTIFHRSF